MDEGPSLKMENLNQTKNFKIVYQSEHWRELISQKLTHNKNKYALERNRKCELAIITYLSRVLQPMQVSCFLANFIMPPVEGVEMEMDLV